MEAYPFFDGCEILALQWEQITDGVCTIDRALHRMENAIGTPKWGICVQFPLCKKAIDNLPEKTGAFVFHIQAEHLQGKWWRRAFINSMQKMGIDYKGRNLTPHSFRHSLNTNLLLAGVPELYVRRYIGWTPSSKDTQAAYTHIKTQDLQIVADAIDKMY